GCNADVKARVSCIDGLAVRLQSHRVRRAPVVGQRSQVWVYSGDRIAPEIPLASGVLHQVVIAAHHAPEIVAASKNTRVAGENAVRKIREAAGIIALVDSAAETS